MPTYAYLLLSLALFFIGTAGVLLRRNAIIALMSVELQLAAGSMALLAFSRALADHKGQIFALFLMALAAAEAAIGLAIVVAIYRSHRSANLDEINSMRH